MFIWLVIACFALYLVALYLFFTRFYLRRQVKLSPAAKGDPRYALARQAHMLLSFLHWLFLVLVLFWIPLSLGLVLGSLAPGHTPGDLTILANLQLDLAQLEGVEASGISGQVIDGATELKIPAPNAASYFLFSAGALLKGVLGVYVLLQLRNIIASYCNGEPFTSNNSQRLRRIGWVLVAAYLVAPFWQFFFAQSVIEGISFSTPAISLRPAAGASLLGIFIGVGLLILAGVIREAEQLHDEQRLTI